MYYVFRNAQIKEEDWRKKITEMEEKLKQHQDENASLNRVIMDVPMLYMPL